MIQLVFDVVGTPTPQGSKRGFYNPRVNRVQIVDDNKPALKTWRSDVMEAAAAAIEETGWDHQGLPVRLDVVFYVPRGKGHFGTGRNAHLLKPNAPQWPGSRPDLDKTLRGILDAMTLVGVYADDSRVVSIAAEKRYADRNRPGAHVEVTLLTQDRHAYTHPRSMPDIDIPPDRTLEDATTAGGLF